MSIKRNLINTCVQENSSYNFFGFVKHYKKSKFEKKLTKFMKHKFMEKAMNKINKKGVYCSVNKINTVPLWSKYCPKIETFFSKLVSELCPLKIKKTLLFEETFSISITFSLDKKGKFLPYFVVQHNESMNSFIWSNYIRTHHVL